MANNNFSLNTVIKLNSKEFQRGIKNIQGSLKSLGMSFKNFAASIGAGLGVYQLISQLKQATIEMNTAKAVLKNVSTVTNEAGISINHYAENLAYLKRLANDYKQDQAGLINGFAKFSAAANGANVSLEQQKEIFESVTRASAFFHLSADKTSNVMLALEQMLSKGKITAEELRRQLGNSLPGAYQLMAKAIGVTTDQFEEMMRKGLVKSTDALPKFAKQLNMVTATLESSGALDSLQLNLNALGNAFKNLADSSGFDKLLNSLAKGATAALNTITNNISLVKSGLLGLLGIPISRFFKGLANEINKSFEDIPKKAKKITKELNKSITTYGNASNIIPSAGSIVPTSNSPEGKRIEELKKQLNATSIIGKSEAEQNEILKQRVIIQEKINLENKKYGEALLKQINLEINLLKLKQSSLGNNSGGFDGEGVSIKESIKLREQQRKVLQAYIRENEVGIQKEINSFSVLKKAGIGLVNIFRNLGVAIKAAFNTVWVTALISALITAVSYIRSIWKESQRIKNILADANKEYDKVNNAISEEVIKVKNLGKIATDVRNSDAARLQALKEINETLGLENDKALTLKSSLFDIVTATEDWAIQLKQTAKISYLATEYAKTQARIYELTQERAEAARKKQITRTNTLKKELEQEEQHLKWVDEQLKEAGTSAAELQAESAIENADPILTGAIGAYSDKVKVLKNRLHNGALDQNAFNEELAKAQKAAFEEASVLDDLDGNVKKLSSDYKTLWEEIRNGAKGATKGGSGASDKNPILELLSDYEKAIKELENQKENGIITKKDFDNAAIELAKKTWEELSKITNVVDKIKGYGKEGILNDILAGYEASKLSKINAIFDEFQDTMDALNNRKDNKNLSEYQFKEAVKEANIALFEQLSAIENIDEIVDKLGKKDIFKTARSASFEDISRQLNDILSNGMPKMKTRDNSLDFKKNKETIANEELDIVNDYIKGVDNWIDSLDEMLEKGARFTSEQLSKIEELKQSLRYLKESVPELEVKVKIAAAEDAINKLQKDLVKGVGSGIKNLANDFDRVIRSVENIKSTFEDEDATGWEKFLSVFNALAQAIEVVTSTITAYNKIMEVSKELTAAKAAKETLATTLAQSAAQQTADGLALAGLTAKIAATEALAKASWEAAGAAAAAAAFLTPLPTVALAKNMAELAAAKATTQGLKAFAQGGIVGGNSRFGDKTLIRANAGEMILNTGQQRRLFNMLNGKSPASSGGEVKFEIDGTKLVGVLNNYNRKRKGK